MKLKLNYFILLIGCSLCLIACGKASFSVDTLPAPPADILVILPNTNFYAEIGQTVPKEAQGDFELTLAKIFCEALFSGSGALELEVRATLSGAASPGNVLIYGQATPPGWSQGTIIFSQNISGGNALNSLESPDVISLVKQIIEQGSFWIDVRVRYSGLDIPQTATIQNTHAYLEGEKSLAPFAPILNLGF